MHAHAEFREEIKSAVSDLDDIHIANFNTHIAHGGRGPSRSHFALVADYIEVYIPRHSKAAVYVHGRHLVIACPNCTACRLTNQDTDEIVMADTNPKTWMRFWRTSVDNMYRACQSLDPSSGRAMGLLRIGRLGHAGRSLLADKYMVWCHGHCGLAFTDRL
jgi:hypothetical protein